MAIMLRRTAIVISNKLLNREQELLWPSREQESPWRQRLARLKEDIGCSVRVCWVKSMNQRKQEQELNEVEWLIYYKAEGFTRGCMNPRMDTQQLTRKDFKNCRTCQRWRSKSRSIQQFENVISQLWSKFQLIWWRRTLALSYLVWIRILKNDDSNFEKPRLLVCLAEQRLEWQGRKAEFLPCLCEEWTCGTSVIDENFERQMMRDKRIRSCEIGCIVLYWKMVSVPYRWVPPWMP